MAVKLTLEFKSVDEAIVALGKLVGVKVSAAPQAMTPVPESTAAAAEPRTRTRRPRADKGQRREPYGPRAPEAKGEGSASDAPKVSEPAAQPVNPSPVASVPQTAVPERTAVMPEPKAQTPAAATPTLAEVQEALNKLYEAKGHDVSLAVLNRFGVNKAKNLLPDAWADFIGLAEHVLDGGQP